MASGARALLKAMLLADECLVSLPEDGTEGMTAGLCALEALDALEALERDGWQFIPPPDFESEAAAPGD